MKSSFSSRPRLADVTALPSLFCIALLVPLAHADCPPGTIPDPNYHQSPETPRHPQKCVPGSKSSQYVGHERLTNPNNARASTLHSPLPMQHERKVGPQGPGPIESVHSAQGSADKNGIIFVGGKAALNPQPIPPGHALQPVPHPSTPIEKPIGH